MTNQAELKQRLLLWWDPKGLVRQRYAIEDKTIARLSEMMTGTSKIWQEPALVIRMIRIFDRLLDMLELQTQNDEIQWKNRSMQRYLMKTAAGERPWNPYDYRILPALFRLIENRVRARFGLPLLRVERDEAELFRRIPGKLLLPLQATLDKALILPLSMQEMEEIENPRLRASLKTHLFLQADEAARQRLVEEMNEEQARLFLHRKEIHATLGPALENVAALLKARAAKKVTAGMRKRHFSWVDPGRYADLERLFYGHLPVQPGTAGWISTLSEQLEVLKTPKRRRLLLNPHAIHASRRALVETVQLVDQMVDIAAEEGPDLIALSTSVPEVQVAEQVEADGQGADALIDLVAESGAAGVSWAKVEDLARSVGKAPEALMLEANEIYFDAVGAQILYEEEGRLCMDPLDMEWWKERQE